ncbi:MAG: hypothetical protein IPQ25_17535 [Chitinophagaceae bacterium]|nr:hypothetical protein [Chitinophagaceae bacterium]
MTIARQTAPGDGICLTDNSVGLGGDNIIVRYLRFRMGDQVPKSEREWWMAAAVMTDAFGASKKRISSLIIAV